SQKRFPIAVDHLTKVVEKGPSSYVFRLRAYAYAAQGDETNMKADLEAAKKPPAETQEEASRRTKASVRVSLGIAEGMSADLRSLIQKVRLSPGNADNKDAAEAMGLKLRCFETYFADSPTEVLKNSKDRLLLALNLLAQSLTDVSGSLEKTDEDALTE